MAEMGGKTTESDTNIHAANVFGCCSTECLGFCRSIFVRMFCFAWIAPLCLVWIQLTLFRVAAVAFLCLSHNFSLSLSLSFPASTLVLSKVIFPAFGIFISAFHLAFSASFYCATSLWRTSSMLALWSFYRNAKNTNNNYNNKSIDNSTLSSSGVGLCLSVFPSSSQ